MADQMTDLGFRFDEPDALDRYFAAHWDSKQLIDLDGAVYLRMLTEPGIQCWLSVDPEDQSLLDWDTHFAAQHQTGVAFDADLSLDAAGQSGNIRMLLHPGEQEQPIVAAVPALAYWQDREPGSPGLAQFACYAEALTVLPLGEEALLTSTDAPAALLTGHVLACQSLVNAYSRKPFWHVVLSCCGITLDLLLSDELLPTPLPAGTLIQSQVCITALVESGVIA